MKLNFHKAGDRTCRAVRRGGSSVLIILVLLACMAALLVANSMTLHALKQELKLIDQRQQKKFTPPERGQPIRAN